MLDNRSSNRLPKNVYIQQSTFDINGERVPVSGGKYNQGLQGMRLVPRNFSSRYLKRSLNIDHGMVPSGSAGIHAGMVTAILGTNAHIPIAWINFGRPKDLQHQIVHD